ncbi:enoyl-CoA hydratase-related protein [Geomonas sp. RF6]|uniref:enoyl-CoA hydratase-related protein n=1 Tax=Geomonas sp. RF6 TaxID=2897342 RepID=UPI001E429EAB|nr:enoyl-CoA hydratase-related protein [Geomonas sp. RF6]UFS70740.1 enoyl-CoA hydratase-related protein [Geomonas sp. RF6]
MELRNLLMDRQEGVLILTVNRPASLNALNSATLAELAFALREINEDASVKVVVITGAGEKAFVAGADIKEMSNLNSFQAHQFATKGQDVVIAMERLKKPVIAAVNGFALGGGLELALACDFIYASENAKFGFPEVGLGIMPGFGGTQNLARLIGPNRAHEMIFSGRMISAEKALAWGVVNEVFHAADLMPKALETAKEIARQGALGVQYAKDAIARGLNMAKEDALNYEATLFGVLFATDDRKEGLEAFVEKRKPSFTGR